LLHQFLIEAVLVCLCGGITGIGLAYLIGQIFAFYRRELSNDLFNDFDYYRIHWLHAYWYIFWFFTRT
jgi:ABC-type antimicrobial peptide transport system permease subunit